MTTMEMRVDEELYPELAEATRIATHIVLLPRGLQRWADMRAIIDEASPPMIDDWVYEATCEGLRLLDAGEEGLPLYRAVSAHMRIEIRHEGESMMMIFERSNSLSAEEAYFGEASSPRAHDLYEHLEGVMTVRQWDMVNAYASTGSPSAAAELTGTSKSNVLRAVRLARKILENRATIFEETTTEKGRRGSSMTPDQY